MLRLRSATSTATQSREGVAQPRRARLRFALPVGELTLDAHRSLASAERDWRAFEPRADGHPYQQFDWLSAWHARICTADVEPFIVVVRDGGGVRMLLPLAIERGWGASCRLVPMGAPVCDYHGPLIDPAFAQSLTVEITHRLITEIMALADADYLLLTHVPPMLGPARNPFSGLTLRPFSTNAHAAALGAEWNAFYAARRGAKTRSRFRTKEKALAKAGALAFTEVTDPQERRALAAEIVSLKASQLRTTAGAFNTFARRDVQEFFQALAGGADHDHVFLFKLSAGGVLVAAALGLVRNGCFYYEVPVFPDHPLRRFSPGHLLLARLMQWAIERGCTRFDFTVGNEAYKDEWCDEQWVLGCGAWARTLRGRIGARVALAEIAAMRSIKTHRALYALAIMVRTATATVRRALRAGHA